MKPLTRIALFASLLFSVSLFVSCKYYIKHDFRKAYNNVNEALHQNVLKDEFFKVHFHNGDVSVLENWKLNPARDSLLGDGQLYDFRRTQLEEGRLAFHLDDIAIIETNQLDSIKSRDNGKIAALTIVTAANMAITLVCIQNPKACFGSCPTFYIGESDHVHDSRAEGFSNSISPSLERQDLDALQYATTDEQLYLTMKNEAFETHAINELNVQAVARPIGKSIYHDSQGKYYQCGKKYQVQSASSEDPNFKSTISQIDEQEYFSVTDSTDLTEREEIILDFGDVEGEDLGLVLNYRQTLLTTFLLYSGIAYMGDEVGDYFAKIETDTRMKKRLADPFEKLGDLDIYLWDYDRERWEFVEGIYETGPISKNLVLAPLLHRKHKGGPVKVKLDMAKGLWRLDYVALTEIDQMVTPHILQPREMDILTGNPAEVQSVLSADEDYLISFPGDEYVFTYDLPKTDLDVEYELFLSSQGYYIEWIRDQWLKEKNLPKLRRMLMNDKNTWRELAEEFKTMESEMETVFWNSTYSNIQ